MKHNGATRSPAAWARPICLLTFAVFLWPAMWTFNAGDWPSPNQYPPFTPSMNACGVVGAWFAYQLRYHFGDGSYPLLLFVTLAAFVWLVRGHIGNFWQRLFGIALVVACTSISSHLIAQPGSGALPVGPGGLFGYALGELLTKNLSRVGTLIILASSLVVGLVFATEGWVLTLPAFLRNVGHASTRAVARVGTMATGRTMGTTGANADGEAVDENPSADDAEQTWEQQTYEAVAQDEVDPVPVTPKKKRRERKPPIKPVVHFPTPQDDTAFEPYPKQIENWRLPPLSLLTNPEFKFTNEQEAHIREQALVLERTLEEFRLDAHVVAIDTGPVITMFELRLGAGIKVSQVATLSNDMARALKAPAVRVVAPIPGKNTIGIEVPNNRKEPVLLKELMRLAGKQASQMALPLFLGKDAGGAALIADLSRMPHLLIAGTTGSGKSVGLNSMIVSLLMTKRPDHVKMILIDPKMVEMSQFKAVPHLMCPIVTDVIRAERILDWAVTKMDERYALLAEARVKNIAAYNQLGADAIFERLQPATDAERARIVTHLPYIVMIIDELADLMMTAGKEVEHHLSRLAQKSRAVGLHIIVATQRPEAKVVTGLIKSNLPSRICFRVSSRMDSRIVLDQNGGEVLLGAGDMLFLPPGSHKPIRAQGTYLHETEIEAILDDLASRATPEFHPELMRIKNPTDGGGPGLRDPLFDKAAMVILESKRGSVSLLQRSLTIGYSRASRLIDQMADAGIVGAYKGSQAREVCMTVEEWKALKQHVAEDMAQGYEADAEEVTC